MLSKFYNCACSLFFAILIISIALITVLTTATSTTKKEGSFPTITLPPLPFGLGSLRPHLTHEQINLHYNAHQNGYVSFLKNWFESATGETAEAISKLYKMYLDDVRAAEIQFVQNAGASQLGDVTKEVPPGMRLNKMNQSFVTFLSSTSRGSSLPVGSKHRNFASQVFNHGLYFSSLTDEPILLGDYLSAFQTTSPLANAVKEQFGSAEKFEEEFEKIATAHFASGWVWLGALRKMVNGRRVTKLFIVDSHDAETFYDRIAGRGKVPVFSLATNGVEQYEFDLDAGDEVEPILVCDVWEHAYYPDYRNKRGDYVNAWFKVVDWKRVDERLQTNPLNVEVRPFRLDDKERGKRLFGKRSTDEREAAGEMTDSYPFFV